MAQEHTRQEVVEHPAAVLPVQVGMGPDADHAELADETSSFRTLLLMLVHMLRLPLVLSA